jgi:hypothetical protein
MTTLVLPRSCASLVRERVTYRDPAPPGEWAVTGAFRFRHRDPATLLGHERQAFATSWLAIGSFRPARVIEVATLDVDRLDAALRLVAAQLLAQGSVPDAREAVAIAHEEIEFARALCAGHAAGTRLVLEREFSDQGLVERATIAAPA